jgi:hypothetical protein
LSDGRFAVVYQSQFNTVGSDIDIHFAFVNASGVASPARSVITFVGPQTHAAAAGRLGGGFGVAWSDERTSTGTADALPNNINFRAVSSTGA